MLSKVRAKIGPDAIFTTAEQPAYYAVDVGGLGGWDGYDYVSVDPYDLGGFPLRDFAGGRHVKYSSFNCLMFMLEQHPSVVDHFSLIEVMLYPLSGLYDFVSENANETGQRKQMKQAFFANNTVNLPEIADHMAKYVIRIKNGTGVTETTIGNKLILLTQTTEDTAENPLIPVQTLVMQASALGASNATIGGFGLWTFYHSCAWADYYAGTTSHTCTSLPVSSPRVGLLFLYGTSTIEITHR